MVYAPPIIYSALFLLQVIAFCVILSFFFYYENKAVGCDRQPNFWCWDDWTCAQRGVGSNPPPSNNPCYNKTQGMPSCLLGVSSKTPSGIAQSCPDSSNPNCICDLSGIWSDPCKDQNNCTATPICS